MLLWSHLLHHVCVRLVQPPTLTYQQPCAVVSLVSTSLAGQTELLFLIASTSAAAPRVHLLVTTTVQSIMSTKLRITTVVLPPKLPTSITHRHSRTQTPPHTQTLTHTLHI